MQEDQPSFNIIKQIQVPKVYSTCISAREHHSGHHMREGAKSTESLIDNSFYTNIS